ncbi:uncharacterized protein LOC144548757 isoform X2 [Carex rostrata]
MNSWTSTRLYSIASVSKEAGFVRCLVINGKYEKAEAEAVVLLQDLVSVLAPARKVPRSKKGKGTGAEPYLGILALVEQVQPWILSLDHEAAKWNHVMVVKPLYRCAAFLTRESRTFEAQGAKSNVHEIHSLYWKCIFFLFSTSPGAANSSKFIMFVNLWN